MFNEVETSDQAKTMLDAEEALGEKLVARALRVLWDEESIESLCATGCNACDAELVEGEVGFIWGRPMGEPGTSQYAALSTYCSEECAEREIVEWANELKRDVLIGWYSN